MTTYRFIFNQSDLIVNILKHCAMLLCKNCGIEQIDYLLVYCFNFISEPPKKIHISCPREVTRVGLYIIRNDCAEMKNSSIFLYL